MTIVVTCLFVLILGSLLWGLVHPLGTFAFLGLVAVAIGLLPIDVYRHAFVTVVVLLVQLGHAAWLATVAAMASSGAT